MSWNHPIPQPPVPQGILEVLKDYPELIQIVQDDLNWKVDKMLRGAHFPPFEEAVWTLESTFSNFIIDAGEALEAAEANGDQRIIERAKAKRRLIGRIRGDAPWSSDPSEHGLRSYFERYRGAFE